MQRDEVYAQEDQTSVYIDETVFNAELLYPVTPQQMSLPLHKHIVAIVWRWNHLVGRGSGLLISNDLVITSAHNFYQKQKMFGVVKRTRIEDKFFEIYVGQCGIMSKFYRIQSVFIPEEYQKVPQKLVFRFDYALVKLTECIEGDQFIQLKEGSFSLSNQKLAIFGYPDSSYKQMGKEQTLQSVIQMGLVRSNRLYQIREQRGEILHHISTMAGQSGSPIIEVAQNQLYAVGIHKGGVTVIKNSHEVQANSGLIITKQMRENLQKNAKLLGAKMFKVFRQLRYQHGGRLVERGNYSYYQQNYQEASQYYRSALHQNSDNLIAKNNLALTLYQQNLIPQAIQLLKQVLQKNPNNNQQVYNNLGNFYVASNQTDQAIKCYQKATEINRNFQAAFFNLANTYSSINKTKEALECYQRCLSINPYSEQACNNLGALYLDNNQLQKGISWFERTLKLNNKNVQALNNSGNAWQLKEQYKKSISYYTQALQVDQNQCEILRNLGVAHFKTSQFEQAAECFKKSLKIIQKDSQIKQYLRVSQQNVRLVQQSRVGSRKNKQKMQSLRILK